MINALYTNLGLSDHDREVERLKNIIARALPGCPFPINAIEVRGGRWVALSRYRHRQAFCDRGFPEPPERISVIEVAAALNTPSYRLR